MEAAFWKERYAMGATGWDLGQVAPPLQAYFDQLTDKTLRILIPGCGFGYEAIYLAEQGFSAITVIDLVPEALQPIREKAPSVHCIAGDFFELTGSFDRIIEQTLFCAILPQQRKAYVEHVSQLLVPGGKYVGVLFDRDFEGGPPFGGSVEEYRNYCAPVFSSFSIDPCYNSAPPRAQTEVFIRANK
jgi:methyl halide transferase